MGLINNRASVLAIVEETEEGKFQLPANATDYIAKQPDFSISPEVEELENEEIKNSIGRSKSILGRENPTASGAHYWRGSGVAGTPPAYAPILKAAFGAQVVAPTGMVTDSGSTVSVVKIDDAANKVERGMTLLVKYATGWVARPILSVSGDDVTLGFNLPTAPDAGVGLGRPVMWKPTNEGHPTLSVSHWLGNGGGIEAIAGARVTSLGIAAESGELVNMDMSLEGTWFGFNPVVITATNKFLDFNDGTVRAAKIAERVYKDPHDLAEALTASMSGLSSDEITVSYNDKGANAGKFTIATDGATLALLWDSGTNSANSVGALLGFDTAADDTGATSYVSDDEIDLASPQSPVFDANSDPVVAKDSLVLMGDAADNVCFRADSVTVTLDTPKTEVGSICAESGVDSSRINSREVTIEIEAALREYDADVFRRFRRNEDTRFFMALGPKVGGNFDEGRLMSVFCPSATVVEPEVTDEEGIVFINFTLRGFVDAQGSGEIYMNQN